MKKDDFENDVLVRHKTKSISLFDLSFQTSISDNCTYKS